MIIVKKPKIRFKGFTETWEQRKFKNIVERLSESYMSDDKNPSVEYEDIISELGTINKDIFNKRIRKNGIKFSNNEILYGKLRPYLHNWLKPDFNGIAVGDWWVLKPINCDREFIFRLIQTSTFDNIANQSNGTKMPRADWNLIANSDFYLPISIYEQKQIGSLFSKLDHLITLHQRKCENLKKLKKFMLQKLFPQNGENVPKVRFLNFTDTWEQRKLGEYVSITSGEAPSKFDKGTELYVKVDDLNYNDKYVVDTQNKVAEHSTVKRVTKGSVVFPKRGAAIMTNKVRIMGIDSYMDTNMMALTSEKLDSEFLYNIISKEGLYKIADTSTIPQINNKHVEPYEVTIPSLAEQRRIGAYFKQLDHFITLHQSKCDKLKEVKKYMLQNMFI